MLFETPVPGQRFFVPEVVQTSAMDCGPAALKSILEGFGVPVAYGRLREACQTDVDGTSIDTVEDIALQLGLQAEQVMLPADHLILEEAQALPAIVVVRRPSGMTHFLVVWGRVGNFLQVMDPATGRRWPTWRRFLDEIYIHTFPVPAEAWRAWAGSEGLLAPLRRRLFDLQIDETTIERLIDNAVADPGWRSLATLDAATRMIDGIVRANGLEAGEQAGKVLQRFIEGVGQAQLPVAQRGIAPQEDIQEADKGLRIPIPYWSVLPMEVPDGEGGDDEQPEQLLLRGAVMVRVLGKRASAGVPIPEEDAQPDLAAPLPPDLEAALKEPAYRPEFEVLNALKEDGLLTPSILAGALFLATVGVTIEALLFQGMLLIGQSLATVSQRIWAMVYILAFVLGLFLLEFPMSATIMRMGRRLETRLRVAFLEKVPRLGDRYFRSRLASDMTQRAHDLRQLRMLPNLGISLLRTGFQLILTTLGVIWLDPISAPFAILGTAFFIALSFITRPILEERDLRLRTHIGALSHFYLDALLGLIPAKTHAAERSMRRQHEVQMYEWVRAGREYFTLSTFIQAFGVFLYSTFAALILVNYISKGGQPNEILLLFYWTLSLPALGQSLAELIQQYPMQRNRVLRLLEPLSAPDEEDAWLPEKPGREEQAVPEVASGPVAVVMQDIHVHAGGHEILQDINLDIQAGEHIAVVGLSGAGKSSLIGLLLGWHRPASGRLLVDGVPLDGSLLASIRRETAWVDPAVQLWNRSLYDNLRYGIEHSESAPISTAIQSADLFGVLDRLPDGLKTSLGEGGGLVSGGEGQRVRLGRAMLRPEIRLALLDEPFRGLDRDRRRKLLLSARAHWQQATLICVTHDVGETLAFPRVLVIEDGRILEDGAPDQLAAQPTSRYRQLLDAEEEVRRGLWESADWRRLVMDRGQLTIEGPMEGAPGDITLGDISPNEEIR